MARRPLRQLVREAREAERSRRTGSDDFSNWLYEGLNSRPDEHTREATFQFENGTVFVDFEFPSGESVLPGVDRRAAYLQLLAEMSLRCVHHTLAQDKVGVIRTVVFDGFIETIDLSTGRDIRPCLVHFEVSRQEFDQLDLSRVDPVACLRGLGAVFTLETDAADFWAL